MQKPKIEERDAAAALRQASKWYTLAAVATALGLVAGAAGVYMHAAGSVWGAILAVVMVASIALYGVLRGIAGACELRALDGAVDRSPLRQASLWYTASAMVTAFGLVAGAVGLYLHSTGSVWGAVLAAVMVASIAFYAVFRGVAGHYESKALNVQPSL